MAESRVEVVPESNGLVALESQEPVLAFSLFKKMTYRKRMLWVAGLSIAGILLQVGFLNAWVGFPFLLVAVLCSWVRGFDNKLDKRAFHHGTAWESVPFERVRTIEALDKKMTRWDASAFDVTSMGGCALLGTLGLVYVGVLVFAVGRLEDDGAFILIMDIPLLIMSQWFNGMRRIHRLPDLLIKVKHVLEVASIVSGPLEQFGELKAQLLMRGLKQTKTKAEAKAKDPEEDAQEKRMPLDLKLSIRPQDAPKSFYGIQAQVVLNRVQGRAYPYFYAVVVAEDGSGLLDASKEVPMPLGIILETKRQDDVEIAIVRQKTTKTSGYHTKPEVSANILRTGLKIGEQFLAKA